MKVAHVCSLQDMNVCAVSRCGRIFRFGKDASACEYSAEYLGTICEGYKACAHRFFGP